MHFIPWLLSSLFLLSPQTLSNHATQHKFFGEERRKQTSETGVSILVPTGRNGDFWRVTKQTLPSDVTPAREAKILFPSTCSTHTPFMSRQ